MDPSMKRKAQDDHYKTGRAWKRRRTYAGVYDRELFLPMPEAGYQKWSRDTVNRNESFTDIVPENHNVTEHGDTTIGKSSAMSRGDRIETAAPISGRHCLLGFRVVVWKTSAVARSLPPSPPRQEQAGIPRPPTPPFTADVSAVLSGPPASSPQDRADSESSEADSLATSNDRNSPQRNAEIQRLDRGRGAFETEYQTDSLVQRSSRLEPKSAALSIADQLPAFEPLGKVSGIDLLAIPMFEEEYRVVPASWSIAFFLGVYLDVDNDSYRRLEESLAPIARRICRQLTFREVLNMPHLIVYHVDGLVKLDFYNQIPPRIRVPWKLPSIPTFSVRAFVQQLSIHLTQQQERSVMMFWNQIPPFNPDMPNVDPTRPNRPARPRHLNSGRYDWTSCLQPIRWFMCPCALRHECKYTGVGAARCAAWARLCTKPICEHGPETDLIHVGSVCVHLWRGLPCRDGTRCKFVHGIAVTVKSIEHQYCHHRTMMIVNKRETA